MTYIDVTNAQLISAIQSAIAWIANNQKINYPAVSMNSSNLVPYGAMDGDYGAEFKIPHNASHIFTCALRVEALLRANQALNAGTSGQAIAIAQNIEAAIVNTFFNGTAPSNNWYFNTMFVAVGSVVDEFQGRSSNPLFWSEQASVSFVNGVGQLPSTLFRAFSVSLTSFKDPTNLYGYAYVDDIRLIPGSVVGDNIETQYGNKNLQINYFVSNGVKYDANFNNLGATTEGNGKIVMQDTALFNSIAAYVIYTTNELTFNNSCFDSFPVLHPTTWSYSGQAYNQMVSELKSFTLLWQMWNDLYTFTGNTAYQAKSSAIANSYSYLKYIIKDQSNIIYYNRKSTLINTSGWINQAGINIVQNALHQLDGGGGINYSYDSNGCLNVNFNCFSKSGNNINTLSEIRCLPYQFTAIATTEFNIIIGNNEPEVYLLKISNVNNLIDEIDFYFTTLYVAPNYSLTIISINDYIRFAPNNYYNAYAAATLLPAISLIGSNPNIYIQYTSLHYILQDLNLNNLQINNLTLLYVILFYQAGNLNELFIPSNFSINEDFEICYISSEDFYILVELVNNDAVTPLSYNLGVNIPGSNNQFKRFTIPFLSLLQYAIAAHPELNYNWSIRTISAYSRWYYYGNTTDLYLTSLYIAWIGSPPTQIMPGDTIYKASVGIIHNSNKTLILGDWYPANYIYDRNPAFVSFSDGITGYTVNQINNNFMAGSGYSTYASNYQNPLFWKLTGNQPQADACVALMYQLQQQDRNVFGDLGLLYPAYTSPHWNSVDWLIENQHQIIDSAAVTGYPVSLFGYSEPNNNLSNPYYSAIDFSPNFTNIGFDPYLNTIESCFYGIMILSEYYINTQEDVTAKPTLVNFINFISGAVNLNPANYVISQINLQPINTIKTASLNVSNLATLGRTLLFCNICSIKTEITFTLLNNIILILVNNQNTNAGIWQGAFKQGTGIYANDWHSQVLEFLSLALIYENQIKAPYQEPAGVFPNLPNPIYGKSTASDYYKKTFSFDDGNQQRIIQAREPIGITIDATWKFLTETEIITFTDFYNLQKTSSPFSFDASQYYFKYMQGLWLFTEVPTISPEISNYNTGLYDLSIKIQRVE